MKLNRSATLVALLLTACSQPPAGVRLTYDMPAKSVVMPKAVKPEAKVEPIFYNGTIYKVSLTPRADRSTSLRIAGMGEGRAKDATGLATSALHHFTCQDNQKSVLTTPPTYDGSGWIAAGHCV